eukprot:TRINITY_DN4010_c0_g2_i1.p1 TRINITY_DN4010_c0_g2~~TRINITY_DN4010_c0_g2_i1.p1  ORF type:complete len:119 (-),score=20.48 TRINITY_DN4010_c0_g2_i1:105-461(-)
MIIVGIILVIVFNDDKTSVLVLVAVTILFGCFVALVVLFAPKIYLSFLTKEDLERRIEHETDELAREIRTRDTEIDDITRALTMTATATATSGSTTQRSRSDSNQLDGATNSSIDPSE